MCSTAQRREEVLMHAQGRGREVTDGCWRHAIGNAVADTESVIPQQLQLQMKTSQFRIKFH